MNIRSGLASISIVLLLFVDVGLGQSKDCDVFDRNVKYKVLSKMIDADKSKIFLEIYIEPRRFRVDLMIGLRERLKTEYCDFSSVWVSLYDTKKLDKMPDPPPHPLLDWESKTPMKGFYKLDRKESTEELVFHETTNGKETEIVFRSDGFCVSNR